MEKSALQKTPRLELYHQILTQKPKIVNLNAKSDFESLYKKSLQKHKGYSAFWRMNEIKYTFDGKFQGNILIVGRTGCGKTTFVQNLGKNEFFGDISTVFRVSKISLSEEREEKIKESFENQEVYFNYPENLDDFNYLI